MHSGVFYPDTQPFPISGKIVSKGQTEYIFVTFLTSIVADGSPPMPGYFVEFDGSKGDQTVETGEKHRGTLMPQTPRSQPGATIFVPSSSPNSGE